MKFYKENGDEINLSTATVADLTDAKWLSPDGITSIGTFNGDPTLESSPVGPPTAGGVLFNSNGSSFNWDTTDSVWQNHD